MKRIICFLAAALLLLGALAGCSNTKSGSNTNGANGTTGTPTSYSGSGAYGTNTGTGTGYGSSTYGTGNSSYRTNGGNSGLMNDVTADM